MCRPSPLSSSDPQILTLMLTGVLGREAAAVCEWVELWNNIDLAEGDDNFIYKLEWSGIILL